MSPKTPKTREQKATGPTGRQGSRTGPKGKGSKRQRDRLGGAPKLVLGLVVTVVALGAIFYFSNRPGSSRGPATAGKYPYQVGSPGPGKVAPPIRLASTAGGTFDLASQRGRSVLLYFQEGLTCQPCWDQLKDIEANWARFQALGIGSMVSITTDPLKDLRQRVADEGLSTPVLSDSELAVSRAYRANSYGMMGDSRDGHSFIVVGPDGRIAWRADYGGAPRYIMDVPAGALLADLAKGLGKTQP